MRCNTTLMNSWHSFSPNGRWMVFSSKSRSPYTQMFLTHIDEKGNDSPAILIENSTAANRAVNIPEFVNIPQDGLTLGDSTAKVTLVEFGDLQCPVCRDFAVKVLPELIASKVRTGEAKIEYRNFPILGDESVTAAAAAVAAGEQDRGWEFIELFYKNQGVERSGYVTEDFLKSIAKGAKVADVPRWDRDRESGRVGGVVQKTYAEAEDLGFGGTPSFAVEGPGTKGLEPLGTPGSLGEFEEAIEAAA